MAVLLTVFLLSSSAPVEDSIARSVVVELSAMGPRPTGSPTYKRAASLVEQRMKEIGLDDVHQEKFALNGQWMRATTRLTVLGPVPRALLAVAVQRSGPRVNATARVVAMPLDPDAVKSHDVKGAFVVATDLPKDYGAWKKGMRVTANALHDAGALALLVPGPAKAITHTGDGSNGKLPVVLVDRNDAKLLENGAQVRLQVDAKVSNVEGANVVGELKGSGAGVVLVHAHLDTMVLTPGARDDAAGVGMILDAMRILRGKSPRRTIRAVMFGAEEDGMRGSLAYVKAHEKDVVDVVVGVDSGAEAFTAFTVYGREDLKAIALPLPVVLEGRMWNTDSAPFAVKGIPVVGPVQDVTEYMRRFHHREVDTADGVDGEVLAKNSALLAALLLTLANGEALPRLDVDAARAFAKPAEDELREIGIFP